MNDFICYECKNKLATVHIKKILNNSITEVHLCTDCANEKFGAQEALLSPQIFLPNIIANLVPAFAENQNQMQHTKEKCPICGCGFADFINTGLLGCSNCYNVFSKELNEIIRKIHGSTQHKGKIVSKSFDKLKEKRSIEELKKQLEELVKLEKYEEAAKLRDKIKKIESK